MCAKHYDTRLRLDDEHQGRTREISKNSSGYGIVTARTNFSMSPTHAARNFPPGDCRNSSMVLRVPMGMTYSGVAWVMGAQKCAQGEYIAHQPMPPEVENFIGQPILTSTP